MTRASALAFLAGLLALVLPAATSPAPGADAPGTPQESDLADWVPLDISAAMNYDAVQTPNEWARCYYLYKQDVERGDEDNDLRGSTIEGQYMVYVVFGQHVMSGSMSYHVQGSYPSFPAGDPTRGLIWQELGQGQGLPPDGRVGRYQLYVDELESPEWHLSSAADPRPGRNTVRLPRPREDRTIVLTLSRSQQRRYRAVNLLFAARPGQRNCVRIVAVYGDATEARLFQGRLMDFYGPETFQSDRRQFTDGSPRGQRQVITYTPIANGWRRPYFRNELYGRATMSEFVTPLRLDAGKVLAALRFETVYENPGGEPLSDESWSVDFFAVSALPAR